jgi:hypothetical protein
VILSSVKEDCTIEFLSITKLMIMRIELMNITRYFFTVSFACTVVLNSKAQTIETESSHTVSSSGGAQLLNDAVLSLAAEKLTSTALAYSFTNRNVYRKKSIVVVFEKGIGDNSKNWIRSNEFTLQYINAFSIVKNKTGRWNNYTGYSIIINPQYIKSGDQYSWATVSALSLYNSLVYSWKKNAVSFELSLPVAGFGSRPEVSALYKGSVNDMLYNSFSNLAFTAPHNFKALNISLQYQAVLTDRLHFVAGASYSYKDISFTNNFLQQEYRVHAGLSYTIK